MTENEIRNRRKQITEDLYNNPIIDPETGYYLIPADKLILRDYFPEDFPLNDILEGKLTVADYLKKKEKEN